MPQSNLPILIDTLSDQEAKWIRNTLRARRISSVQWLLHQRDIISSQTYLSIIHGLMVDNPNQILDLIDRWPVGYLLNLLHDNPKLAERIFCRLSASLMFACGEIGYPLKNYRLTIPDDEHGQLPCLEHNGYILFKNHQNGESPVLSFTDNCITLNKPNNGVDKCPLPLCIDTIDSTVEFHPFSIAFGWEKPVIPDASMVLIESCLELHSDQSIQSSRLPEMLSIEDSLADAYRILQTVWPEVISWVDILIPAFVKTNTNLRAGLRLSGSFGPSSPVYLSEVHDPALHAEDILHELQHERFHLYLAEDQFFGKWNDPQLYVSPYRDDPRPLRGLHLGLHAFLAVNELRLRSHSLIPLSPCRIKDMAVAHQKNLFAYSTLIINEKLTLSGERYFAEVKLILERQNEAIADFVTRESMESAITHMKEHIAKVVKNTPSVTNAYSDWTSVGAQDLALVL